MHHIEKLKQHLNYLRKIKWKREASQCPLLAILPVFYPHY